jgi:hypothetical protein
VGYFLSPFDFLKDFLTFFLLSAAFNRFVLLLFFMETSLTPSPHPSPLWGEGRARGVI